MKAPWEYLEQISEIVYVSDAETDELLYLNLHARKTFGFSSEKEYLGQKCYAVLQGLSAPCLFCTNAKLEEGGFYEWTHHNPILNRTFSLKDTLIRHQGRLCRMEIAIDMDTVIDKSSVSNMFLYHRTFMNECLVMSHAKADPNESLNAILEFLGTQLHCSQVLIYQIKRRVWLYNTNSWSPNGSYVNTQPLRLEFSLNASDWFDRFARNEPIFITDLHPLKSQFPSLYFYLSPENVQSMVVCPLLFNDEVIGFLRLDNPPQENVSFITALSQLLTYFISSILQRQDLVEHLKSLSYYDQLTHTLNRYALNQYMAQPALYSPTGIIYCDIVGLKSVNDSFGHSAGDQLILKCSQLLLSIFSEKEVYRIGGDEFLVVCIGVSQQQFEQQVELLRQKIALSDGMLSIGSVWNPGDGTSFEALMKAADQLMYQDKQSFYRSRTTPATDHCAPPSSSLDAAPHSLSNNTAFTQFIRYYYFDPNTFLDSITKPDTTYYIFCGDLQENVYFISDNLRDDFNFSDNLVYDFVNRLEDKIYEPDRHVHAEDMQSMLRERKTFHSIRYRIYDRNGDLLWMHCRGSLKWSPDGGTPLFFSGSMVSMKGEFDIDHTTGLPTAKVARSELTRLSRTNTTLLIACFILNSFDDINHAFGREVGDQILHEIASQLDLALGEYFHFYRLDGIHFMAISQTILDPVYPSAKIQETVKQVYQSHRIHLVYPCSIGVLYYPEDLPEDDGDIIDTAIMAAQYARSMPEHDYLKYSSSNTQEYKEQVDLRLALNYCVKQDFEGFRIVIQPQARTKSQDIYGGEVLLRWRYKGRDVPPSVFIPLLEQSGLIVPVGKWLVRQVMETCKRLVQLEPDFCLSFNVSYVQIMDSTFIDCIRQALSHYQLPGQNLMIELTETHFDEMPEHLTRFIQQCKELGISFALDDFGSGYSGLQLLLHYPADLIKLDRSLIQEVTTSKEKFDFLMSIVYACRRFGKSICVEGVETQDEFQLIQQTACDFIQGFYLYRPMEVGALCEMLASAPPTPAQSV